MIMKYDGKIAKMVYREAKMMYRDGVITKERLQEYKDVCFVPLFAPKPHNTEKPASLPIAHVSK